MVRPFAHRRAGPQTSAARTPVAGVLEDVDEMNQEEGANRKTGWRPVQVAITKLLRDE
jgi:hypothetical protein